MTEGVAGETRVITGQGAIAIEKLAGKTVNIRTTKGFEEVTVEDKGLLPCYEISIQRYSMKEVVFASNGQLWFIRDKYDPTKIESIKSQNLAGEMRVPTAFRGAHTEMDEEGIRHGAVYGDGYDGGKGFSEIELFGGKVALKEYFDDENISGDIVRKLPLEYQVLPKIKMGTDYIAGFIAGLMATDGAFGKGVEISQIKDMNGIKRLMESIGINVTPPNKVKRDTNYKQGAVIYNMSLVAESFPPELDILGNRDDYDENKRADDSIIKAVQKGRRCQAFGVKTSTDDMVLEYGVVTGAG